MPQPHTGKVSVIPCIDISPLFAERSAARNRADSELLSAAKEVGFIQVTGLGAYVDLSEARRADLKRIFSLTPERLQPLWRQKFAPDHLNVYRGWFPLQEGHLTAKEGIDMGPDVVTGAARIDPTDPLRELTPLPLEIDLPGWRAMVSRHYVEMARLGRAVMRCLARGLDLAEAHFDPLFDAGISTLRLIHYPIRPGCSASRVVGAAHIDSGLITLLLQDGVSGLQVKDLDGSFVDVPVREDAVTVNFGRLLALWSGGRIRATEHRVLGGVRPRFSFPFFYEPRVDALIEPLPGTSTAFKPFLYGDFLWQATTRFVEFHGMENLRASRGSPTAAAAAASA